MMKKIFGIITSMLLLSGIYVHALPPEKCSLAPESIFRNDANEQTANESGLIGKKTRFEGIEGREIIAKDADGTVRRLPYTEMGAIDLDWVLQKSLTDPKYGGIVMTLTSVLKDIPLEESPRFVQFAGECGDMFGFASVKDQLIGIHQSIADDPAVPLFHEVEEYLIEKGLIKLELNSRMVSAAFNKLFKVLGVYRFMPSAGIFGGEIVIMKSGARGAGFREMRRVPISGDAFSIVRKGPTDPHYLIRALSREIYGASDVALTGKIKQFQGKTVESSSTAASASSATAGEELSPEKRAEIHNNIAYWRGNNVIRAASVEPLHTIIDRMAPYVNLDKDALEMVSEMLGHRDRGVFMHALKALEKCERQELYAYLAANMDIMEEDRALIIITTLKNRKTPRLVDIVMRAAKSRNLKVRKVAVITLVEWKDPRTLPALREALADTDPFIRAYAIRGIIALRDTSAYLTVLQMAGDLDAHVKTLVKLAMPEIRDAQYISPLIKMLNDPRIRIADSACEQLARFAAEGVETDTIIPQIKDRTLNKYDPRQSLRFGDNRVTARLIINLIYRQNEIDAKTLDPLTIMKIYANKAFGQQTETMSYANQYSIARGIELALKRFSLPAANENIETLLPYLLRVWKEHAGRVILDKDSTLIVGCNEGAAEDAPNALMFVTKFNLRQDNILFYTGSRDKQRLLKAIGELHKNGTLWLLGHGGKTHFWLEGGEENNTVIPDLHPREGVSYVELADALVRRAKQSDGSLSDITILIDSCLSADLAARVYNLLQKEAVVKGLPVMVTLVNRGAIGTHNYIEGGLMVSSARASLSTNRALIMEDVHKIEDAHAGDQDLAFFYPVAQEVFKQLKSDLGVREDALLSSGGSASLVYGDSSLDSRLAVLDVFEPLYKTGGTPSGEPVMYTEADGARKQLVFPADEPAASVAMKIERALKERDGDAPKHLEKTIGVLQRYFRAIRADWPDTIEIRDNVAHYAALDGRRVCLTGRCFQWMFPLLIFFRSYLS